MTEMVYLCLQASYMYMTRVNPWLRAHTGESPVGCGISTLTVRHTHLHMIERTNGLSSDSQLAHSDCVML